MCWKDERLDRPAAWWPGGDARRSTKQKRQYGCGVAGFDNLPAQEFGEKVADTLR